MTNPQNNRNLDDDHSLTSENSDFLLTEERLEQSINSLFSANNAVFTLGENNSLTAKVNVPEPFPERVEQSVVPRTLLNFNLEQSKFTSVLRALGFGAVNATPGMSDALRTFQSSISSALNTVAPLQGVPFTKGKIGTDLQQLGHVAQTHEDTVSLQSINSDIQIFGDSVVIDALAVEDSATLLKQLEALGLQNGSTYGRLVSGLLPVDQINRLEDLDELLQVTSTSPISNIGDTTSQADVALNADDARFDFGLDGSGLKIGVLSDSFNNLGGEAAGIASGDLPGIGNPFGNTTPIEILLDLDGGGSDEGRAMLELIHDLAPGATLAFRTAFLGAADFANGINELVAAGADIIVDDIGYLDQPFFQDGVIAQAASAAVAAGVPFFSAAGNSGRDSYESAFTTSALTNTAIDGVLGAGNYILHDFDPGGGDDPLQSFFLGSGESIRLSFQWDQPHASAGGIGSANDLDILLLDSTGNTVLDGSLEFNVGGNAVEIFSYTNTGPGATFNLAISQFLPVGGPTPSLIKYIDFNGNISNAEFFTNSPTSFGHPNAPGVAGVGAAAFFNTPEFGRDPAQINNFSSTGGIPILFDTAGNALSTPDVRSHPLFTAVDGANTTFFGNDSGADPDTFPNFFGTSAAAPHAAAVAALLLEADPTLTPAQINQVLSDTALDLDDPFTAGFDTGFDFTTGFGLIQADRAVTSVLAETTVSVDAGEFLIEQTNGISDEVLHLTEVSGSGLLRAEDLNNVIFADTNVVQATPNIVDAELSTVSSIIINNFNGNDEVTVDAIVSLGVTVNAGAGNDTITGGDNQDTLAGQNGNDVLGGGRGDDTITGGNGDDTVTGGDGNDTISGGQGSDSLEGQNDSDNIFGQGGGDIIDGGGGNDRIIAGGGNDQAFGVTGLDFINGGAGNDTLDGGADQDTLIGATGNDLLIAGSGGDVLNGTVNGANGVGEQDTLQGSLGERDRYLLGNLSASVVYYEDAGSGDTSFALIQNFELLDRIVLIGSSSDYSLSESQGDTFLHLLEAGSSDAIARIENTTGLNLNDSQFIYRI